MRKRQPQPERQADLLPGEKREGIPLLPEPPRRRLPVLAAPILVALAASAAAHLTVIYTVGFTHPDPRKLKVPDSALEVVLVNTKSASRPLDPSVIAQANLEGGGNTVEPRRARSPLPKRQESEAQDDANLTRRAPETETQADRLLTGENAARGVEQALRPGEPTPPMPQVSAVDLVEKSMQFARLEAEISRKQDPYQQRPKRMFFGARAQESRYAMYIDNWREKVERVGNLNYPEEAKRKKLYGSLRLTVLIRADGSVARIDINRSSGHKELDEAAIRIVNLAAPFAPFPDDIRQEVDELGITRTWTFTRADQLVGE